MSPQLKWLAATEIVGALWLVLSVVLWVVSKSERGKFVARIMAWAGLLVFGWGFVVLLVQLLRSLAQ